MSLLSLVLDSSLSVKMKMYFMNGGKNKEFTKEYMAKIKALIIKKLKNLKIYNNQVVFIHEKK